MASPVIVIVIAVNTGILESLRAHIAALPPLVKFIVGLSAVLIMPPLSRRVKLPSVVGLLLAGILLGPHSMPGLRLTSTSFGERSAG
jgi:Kef-type K+ transport system membrane component KefB